MAFVVQHGCEALRGSNWQAAWKTSMCKSSLIIFDFTRRCCGEILATTKAFIIHAAECNIIRKQALFLLPPFNREHPGESILYLWVERVREFLVEKSQCSGTEHPGKDNPSAEEGVDDDDEEYLSDFMALKLNTENAHLFMDQGHDEELPLIKHGNPVTDRRSTFQPHLALVVSPRQVKMVLEKLYMNKKIASATHNIYAYRIYCEDKNSFLQDCEDDGETAAGGRLLHLLQILDVRNVMVVVSRWYGGILLGPDRFKHINNCARNILVEEGYIASVDEAAKSGAKTKRAKSRKTK
uniref:Impact RWD domain protein n=1 Tax=Oryzias latipes TaxID=8090 RepID=A0A3P9IZD0_ORYLA